MKLCIFGSRKFNDPVAVAEYVMGLPPGIVVVSGAAHGVDAWAAHVAEAVGLEVVPFEVPPAEWKKYGKAAGPMRNARMVAFADAGQAFRAIGESRGTDDCARKFKAAGKPVEIWPKTVAL